MKASLLVCVLGLSLIAYCYAGACVTGDVNEAIPWAGKLIDAQIDRLSQLGLSHGCYFQLVNAICSSCAPNTAAFTTTSTQELFLFPVDDGSNGPIVVTATTVNTRFCGALCDVLFNACFDDRTLLGIDTSIAVDASGFCQELPNALGQNSYDAFTTYTATSDNNSGCYFGVYDRTVQDHLESNNGTSSDPFSFRVPFGGFCVPEPTDEVIVNDDGANSPAPTAASYVYDTYEHFTPVASYEEGYQTGGAAGGGGGGAATAAANPDEDDDTVTNADPNSDNGINTLWGLKDKK